MDFLDQKRLIFKRLYLKIRHTIRSQMAISPTASDRVAWTSRLSIAHSTLFDYRPCQQLTKRLERSIRQPTIHLAYSGTSITILSKRCTRADLVIKYQAVDIDLLHKWIATNYTALSSGPFERKSFLSARRYCEIVKQNANGFSCV